jgi:hypothetical protein
MAPDGTSESTGWLTVAGVTSTHSWPTCRDPDLARLDDAAEVHAGEQGAVGVQAVRHPGLLARESGTG